MEIWWVVWRFERGGVGRDEKSLRLREEIGVTVGCKI